MEVELLMKSLGKFGRWQMIYFFVLGTLLLVPTAWQMLAIVWLGYEPPHHCKVPANSTLEEWIPMEEDGQWSKCKMYVNFTINNQTTDCLHGWQYEEGSGPTIVTQWNLVCQYNFLVQTSQTAFVAGIMTGALFFTTLGDKFGRKPIYLGSQMCLALFGCISAVVPNVYAFMFLRYLIGVFQQGCLLLGFVLLCELFSADERTFVGILGANFWAFGCAILPLIAYLIDNWVHLQLFISLCSLLNLPLFYFLPESVAWLYANDRMEEAKKILQKAASVNKVILPEIDLHVKHRSTDGINLIPGSVKNLEQHHKVEYSCLDFVRNRTMILHLVACGTTWFLVTLIYYGLTWSTAQSSGNRYLNAFFNGFVEIPAYTICYFVANRFGRRRPTVVFFIIGGIALFILTFLTNYENQSIFVLSVIMNMIGKFGITGAFGIIFLYAAEIFPTNLRSQAIGLCSFLGRVGTIFASFASYVAIRYYTAMSLTFAGLSIIAAAMIMILPETNHLPLPETIEEIEAWKRRPNLKRSGGIIVKAGNKTYI